MAFKSELTPEEVQYVVGKALDFIEAYVAEREVEGIDSVASVLSCASVLLQTSFAKYVKRSGQERVLRGLFDAILTGLPRATDAVDIFLGRKSGENGR